MVANTKKGSPVIIRGKKDTPIFWENVDDIEKYVREESCTKFILGIELHFWNADYTEPKTAYAQFIFSNEQAAADFYHLFERNEKYRAEMPKELTGLARLNIK